MKRIMLLVLAMAMVLMGLTAASAEESQYPYDGTNEPLKLLMVVENTAIRAGYTGWGDTEFFKYWQAQTGINVDVTEVADDASLMLTLAAGEYPDIIMAYGSTFNGGLSAMISDELAINLSDYSEYMPDYEAVLDSHPSYRPYVTSQGGIRFFAELIASDNIVTRWRGMVVRQDMLDKLGKDVPSTNDEFYELLKP